MFWEVDPPAGNISDEKHLQDDLDNRQKTSDHHEEIRLVGECCQGTGDHAEYCIDKETKRGDAQKNVIEITLLLSLELQTLDAYETDDDRDDRESH